MERIIIGIDADNDDFSASVYAPHQALKSVRRQMPGAFGVVNEAHKASAAHKRCIERLGGGDAANLSFGHTPIR